MKASSTTFLALFVLGSISVVACGDDGTNTQRRNSSNGGSASTNPQTGGSSSVGTGGSTTNSSTGGTTGTDTGGTSSTGTGGTTTVPGPSVPLPQTDGWVDETGNTVGVQGAWYTFSDASDVPPGGSTITPETFKGATEICTTGSAGQVKKGSAGALAYAQYWGAGVGLNLKQARGEPGTNPPEAYDATANKVIGFSFSISGTTVPTGLRFKAKLSGDTTDYCTGALAAGANTVLFSTLHKDCWLGTAGVAPDATKLEAIQIQVVTNEKADVPFDFCITDFAAITG